MATSQPAQLRPDDHPVDDHRATGGAESPAEAAARYRRLDRKIYMSLADAELLSRALAHAMRALDPPPDLLVGLANGALMTTAIVAEELALPSRITKVRRKGSRIKKRLAVVKRLALPVWLVRSHWFGLASRAFDRRFGAIETDLPPARSGRPGAAATGAGHLGDPARADFGDPARADFGDSPRADFGDVTGRVVAIVDDCIDTGNSVRHVHDRLRRAGAAHVHVCVLCWSENSTVVLGDSPAMTFLHRRIHFYPWSNNSPHYRDFERWLARRGQALWR